ncbi:MAG: S8 family serine peptidase [Deltaproteobacteria bacterium]|nr:S8 family serine peptidase [Deltaproteobacteria bacterium]
MNESVDLIGAPNAWSRHIDGSGYWVAILDTGIRITHEMFAGKNVFEICFASGRYPAHDGSSGDCPNGLPTMVGPGAAAHHPSKYYGFDHGSHIAGIVAGNSGALKGVAPGANILAIQIYSKYSGGYPNVDVVGFWESDLSAALDYTVLLTTQIDIASVCLAAGIRNKGSTKSCDLSDGYHIMNAINLFRSVGIPTFASAGNKSYPESCDWIDYPACLSLAVAVGASTKNDTEASYSNWNAETMAAFAPGERIYAPIGLSDSSYAWWYGSGTATAHAAGAFALLRQFEPAGDVNEMLARLLERGVPINTKCSGGGSKPRIRVDKAMMSEAPVTSPDRKPMYRAYNPYLQYHFFTSYRVEFQMAVLAGYSDESTPIPFYVMLDHLPGTAQINRLYDPNRGVHYYTAKLSEADALEALGWRKERGEGYIFTSVKPGTSQIFKLYNTVTGTHLYTYKTTERDFILANMPTWQEHRALGYAYLSPTSARLPAEAEIRDPFVARDAAAVQAAVSDGKGVKTGVAAGSGGTAPASRGALAGGRASAASGLGNAAAASAAGRAVRDFNGDGASDLVWLDGEGKVNLWYLNGESVLGAAKLAPSAPAGWQLSQVGDFNGDGHPDLLWYDPAGGAAALWLLAGETVSSENALGRVADPAWAPVLAADFNGDGTDDLLWRNPATGGVAVWYLANGKLVKSATLPATLGPGWQVR